MQAILETILGDVQPQRGRRIRSGPELGRAAGLERGLKIHCQVVPVEIQICAARTWAGVEADEAMLHFAQFDRAAGVVERARLKPTVELAKPDGSFGQWPGYEIHVLRTGPLPLEGDGIQINQGVYVAA